MEHKHSVLRSIAELITLQKCETLGTNFVDIKENNRVIAVQVGKKAAETWLDDLLAGKVEAENSYMQMKNIIAWPLAAAGNILRDYENLNHNEPVECHKLNTPTQVFFYEQDFYVLSNFSAFRLKWSGADFNTSEHAYHWEKFHDVPQIQNVIFCAPSAHEAFKLAERFKDKSRPDWDEVRVGIMENILCAKAEQPEYVRRKLLATGDRELIEDSWRDDFWGWGADKNGKNMLGKLWMKIRAEMREGFKKDGQEMLAKNPIRERPYCRHCKNTGWIAGIERPCKWCNPEGSFRKIC